MTDELREKLKKILKKDLTDVDVKAELSYLLDPWEEARGILRNKNINPLRTQKSIRSELERNRWKL